MKVFLGLAVVLLASLCSAVELEEEKHCGGSGLWMTYGCVLYSYGVSLPLIWACRHLSGAACVYIPPSILRLPYSSHLSYIIVFVIAAGIKHKGWILFLSDIKDSLHIHRWYGTFTIVIQQLILWLSLLVRVVTWYGVQVRLKLD